MKWTCVHLILVLFVSGFIPVLLSTDPPVCSVMQQSVCKDKCIPITWLCNGEKDCPDGTDEQCVVACRGDINAWQCDNGKCISKSWKCDGVGDCLDGSDESDCGCSGNKIQCSNNDCIDLWEVCDGHDDCEDGSDEQNCSTRSCMPHQLQCKNKVCIMESWKCDGINNCGDGSDEELCETCIAGDFKCGDGKCINSSQVCNKKVDCQDGSDETNSCGSRCSDANGGCMQKCEDVAWGVNCSCNEGWKLQPDRQSCIDIDECSMDYGPCHQLCTNVNGSFLCDCIKGFELQGKTVCDVVGNTTTVILLAKKGDIGIVDARTGDYQHLFSVHGRPIAVAYYLSSESYFWIDEKKTLQFFVIGEKQSTSLYPDVGKVNSLSVDWFTGQLYWASSVSKSISVGLTNGRGYVNILEKDIVPDQLIVFPNKRYMYWVNYGKKGNTTIDMAGMDGSDRHVIVFVPMEQPIGLTLDHITSRLYWVSEYKESIETINTDGSGRFTFPDILYKDQNVLGLSVFEGWFFLADEKQLFSLSRNNPAERELFLNTSNISAFTVLHEFQQSINELTPCSSGVCSHICLLSPVLAKSYKCACPAGLFLLPSGKCENLKIMYGDKNEIHLLELGFQGVFVKKTLVIKAAKINLMDFDWKRDLVYWTDDHGLLLRSNGVLGNVKVIQTGGAVCVAKIDIPTGNIYWLPCERNRICVTKHTGSGTKAIYESIHTLQNLMLNWKKALLYVMEDDKILQMNLVGDEVETVLNGTGFAHMSLDIKSNSIVWSKKDSFYSFGLLKKKLFHLKVTFTSTVMDAFEPYLLAYNNSMIEIWDRATIKIVSTVKEANLTKLIMVTSSHIKGSHSACSLDNGGCMSEEICVPGFRNVLNCLCPDDQDRCHDIEEASPEKLPFPETLFCPRTFVSCRDGKECVSSDFVCDGEKDCLDGSDEEDCTAFCSNTGMFQCLKGIKCIDERYRCDGVPQCPDGSDERNCWTPSESCALRCDRNGRCIPKSWLCDNKADCFDETDEQGCEQKQCSSSKFRCMNGLCLPRTMVCDGDNDCGDFSDEANCTISKPVHCQRGEVKCESGECILKEWKCDGANDCKDGSDEKECKFETIECEVAQWACARKDQCIPSFWQCDGEKDCRDGSDETRCEIQNCKHDMFRCKNFDCVPTEVVCDGKSDCLDSSDEGGKCNETCGEDCSLACFLSPIGPKCMCDKGFKLNGNRTLCIDINECKEVDPSPCSQSCVNQNGTYNCTCHPGYVLQPDGHQCKVTGTEPVLLVAVQFDLIIYKLRTLEEEILTSTDKRSMIFSVDYDVLDQKIFWMDLNAESIKWLTMGTNTKGTLVKGIKSDCIAVDWVGRNLYWTDGIAGHILATALNASWKGSPEYTVVIDEHLAQPRSLVLQPLSGIMYWSEIGVNSQIEQAGMDGKQRRILIAEQLGWPTGLAVDLLSWKIYWSDDKFHSIGSATLDGTNIKVIQIENIQSPFALTVFEDEIYWSEIKTRTVQKMNKKTGKNASVLIKRHGQPYGLKVMHEVLQPKTDNPCQLLKCSHLCLLGPGLNGSCWCPTGFFLSINMWNCVPFKELHVLLLTLSTSVIQINLQKRAFDQKAPMKTQIAFLSRINPFSSMDYNVQNQSLVFAVKSGGYIATAKIKADPKDWRKVLFVEDSVTSIAVDWITGNIFWISTNKPFIQVGTSNGMYKTVVMSEDLYQPYCIAVFPSIGIMCYFDAGLPSQKNSGKIECADMDGTERRVLWRKSKLVTGLTFVDSGSRLYWADREYGTIESIRVDGSDYKVIRSGLHGLNAFTTGDEVLFWTMVANGKTKVWFSGMDTYEKRSFEMDQKVVDLKVYSSRTQQGSNGCSKNNGGCSQICLPNLVGHTCRCSSTHRLVNGTQCHEQLYCDEGARICKDGLKCILNNKICDHQTDCLDGSDEKNCEYNIDGKSASNVILPTLMAAPKTPASKDVSYPSSTLSVDFENPEYNQTNEDFERKMESRPCTSETCNMRGTCVVENDLVKCRCFDGYGGDFCEEGLKPLAVPLTVGTVAVLLVFVIAAGIFVLVTRRKALQRTYSSASSRTLTRQTAKDMEPLEAENREFSETFFNEAFDAEGTSRTMIETHVEDPKG